MNKTIFFRTVPLLLILVALMQLYNSNFNNLTPWKGGGFGMFSTNYENEINAIGYKGNGDSILISVESNKLNLPIPKNFLETTQHFANDKNLSYLGLLILNSYLKPETIKISQNHIDSITYSKIFNKIFYQKIYVPKFYANKKLADKDSAIQITKIKIQLYKVNFYEYNYTYKKEFIKQIMLSK